MNDQNEAQPQCERHVKKCCRLLNVLSYLVVILISIIVTVHSSDIINFILPIIYPTQFEFADTTAFKSSIHEFSKLEKIDYYPIKTFSSAIWDTAKITTEIKYQLEIALSKTTLSDETKNQYSKYFDKLNNLFKDLEILSDESADFYFQQKAAFSTFEYSAQRMKRMVQISDLKGLMIEIDYFKEYIYEA
eukprot:162169_1